MPRPSTGKPKSPLRVEALKHDDEKRRNIPTVEFQLVLKQHKRDPVEVRYPRGDAARAMEPEKAATLNGDTSRPFPKSADAPDLRQRSCEVPRRNPREALGAGVIQHLLGAGMSSNSMIVFRVMGELPRSAVSRLTNAANDQIDLLGVLSAMWLPPEGLHRTPMHPSVADVRPKRRVGSVIQ